MAKILARIGALLGILFLLSVVDILVSNLLSSKELYRSLPGEDQFVSGTLSSEIPSKESLAFESDTPFIHIEFVEGRGRMWRAKLNVSPSMKAGSYHFKVHLKWDEPEKEKAVYSLLVFNSMADYRASDRSFFEKYLGIGPWWMTAATLPLILLAFGFSYWLSTRQEVLLNKEGLASIFKVTRDKTRCEINFSFGQRDSLQVGESLLLFSPDWKPVGEAKVKQVKEEYAVAEVDPTLGVKPDFLVGKKRS